MTKQDHQSGNVQSLLAPAVIGERKDVHRYNCLIRSFEIEKKKVVLRLFLDDAAQFCIEAGTM